MSNNLGEEDKALKIINDGGIILCPTDTVWSLCCDALNHNAVKHIYSIKKKDTIETMVLMVNSIDHLKKYIVDIHPRIETLIHYHRRPISVMYRANENLPSYLSDNNGTIAIRVVKEPTLTKIINSLNRPIVSTSANLTGAPIPKNYNDIHQSIKDNVDYIFSPKFYPENKSESSMLISFDEEGELIFLRK